MQNAPKSFCPCCGAEFLRPPDNQDQLDLIRKIGAEPGVISPLQLIDELRALHPEVFEEPTEEETDNREQSGPASPFPNY